MPRLVWKMPKRPVLLCDDVTGSWTTFCDKILHQLIGSLSHYLQGFIHTRRCRISSINSMSKVDPLQQGWSGGLLGVFCMFLLTAFVTSCGPALSFPENQKIWVFEVRTVWKRVMEVGSIILRIYGSNMNIMNSLFSQGYHLKCRWWWWFQRYVQSHRLEKDVFFTASLQNCHQMPTPELDGFHKTYTWKNKWHAGKKAHICTNSTRSPRIFHPSFLAGFTRDAKPNC